MATFTGTKYAGKPLLDPAQLRKSCEDRQIPYEQWFGKPNSFRIPLGREPGRGHILMRKADLGDIDLTEPADLYLKSIQFKKIYVVRSECITPGGEDDANESYLVEVADRRVALAKIPCSESYNILASDGSDYVDSTTNSGTPWTWSGMFGDLWTLLGAGSTPSLPFSPHGTPENFDYRNTYAWTAICDLMDRLACAVKYNPVTDTFTVVRLGVADSAAAAAENNFDGSDVWNTKPSVTVAATRPEKIRVLFRRFPEASEGEDKYYAADVTLAAEDGTVSGSYVTLYDDMGALGASGTPSNDSDLSDRADERADDWLRKHDGFDAPALRVREEIDGGAMTILGSTFGAVAFEDRGGGAKTTIAAAPTRSLEEWRPGEAKGQSVPPVAWIKASGTTGSSPYNYSHATVSEFNEATGTWTESTDVWLTSHHGGANLSANTHYLGRLEGQMTNGSSVTRPLYVTIADAHVVGGTAYAGLIGTGAQTIDGIKNFRAGIIVDDGSAPTGTYNDALFSVGQSGCIVQGTVSGSTESSLFVTGGAGVYFVKLFANPGGGSTSEIILGAAGTIYMRDAATGGRIQYGPSGTVYFPDGLSTDVGGTPTIGMTTNVTISGTTLEFTNGILTDVS